jgi:hypothetical protein
MNILIGKGLDQTWDKGEKAMSIPDIPTGPEVSAQSKSGIKYHIMGAIQQTQEMDIIAHSTGRRIARRTRDEA